MSNMYDHAQELARTLQESEQFGKLKQAYEEVMNDEVAKELFERFRDTQMDLQEKQMEGTDITEEEVQAANEIVAEVQENEQISLLLETEQQLNSMINEISQIITEPLEELYSKTTS